MTDSNRPQKATILACLVLALVTLALYLPSLGNGYVQYDDQQYVTENLHVQAGLSLKGILWSFGYHASNWHPLTWMSHMLDCQLYGARAWGHHLTSVLLHVASTVLLFLTVQKMTGFSWRSAAVAALFGWHPLHVESVAWIAERKDVLCGFFWILTLWLYPSYTVKPSLIRYLTCLGAFCLCLMSKPMGVTLPMVLLLLDFWPLNRFTSETDLGKGSLPRANPLPRLGLGKILLEKLPFVALSIGVCALTVLAQDQAIVSTHGLPISERIGHSFIAWVHYTLSAFLPFNLAVYYPYDRGESANQYFFCAFLLAVATLVILWNWKRRQYLAVGWFWFLGTLVPVIGLVQVGDQAWADRYTYLPLIGLFTAAVWLANDVIKNSLFLKAGGATLAVLMIVASSLQLQYWKSTRTLFDHAAKVTHENYMALTVLGSELAREGKYAEAMDEYQTALSYKPTFPEAHFFMANALEKLGRLDEAVTEYNRALWFKPTQEQTHIFLGIVLGRQNKYDEAEEHYRAAIKLNPESPVAENNLARLLHTQGHFDEAIQHYRAALAINPKLTLAHNNLGILLLQQGDATNGISHLREALNLSPTNTETQFNLAMALNHQELWAEAAELFSKSAGPLHADPKANYEFARALAHTQQTRQAMSHYAAALLAQPDFADALDGLSWILATSTNAEFRNGPQAASMSAKAVELTSRKDALKLKTLAAALAETGNFTEATKTLDEAIELVPKSGNPPWVLQLKQMQEQFKAAKPWRE